MSERNRGGWDGETVGIVLIVSTVFLALLVTNVAVRAGHALAGISEELGNPLEITLGVFTGRVAWPVASTVVAVVLGLIFLVLLVLVTMRVTRRRSGQGRVDEAARRMGRGRDIESISERAVKEKARRLGVDVEADAFGIPIARQIGSGKMIYQSWEDTCVDIHGTRAGKTTSRVIPAILAGIGPVVVTSNKRDVVDATRGVREDKGRVWVYDPQGMIGEQPSWWWNPLTYVTDDVKARSLANLLAFAFRPAGGKEDAYFGPASKNLLSGLLLAAALDGRPITQVNLWQAQPWDDEPAQILKRHGYDLMGAQLEGFTKLTEKQRDGVYGGVDPMIACLTTRAAAPWFTPTGPADPRPQFEPADFVRSNETLYLVSREGEGTLGPLILALTVAVAEEAERFAATQPGGRLARPMLLALDEAANICRWPELPNLYSHYGSRGIIPMTILQSWSQGVEVWGENGMKKLWEAANVRVYGGGTVNVAFLDELSRLIGHYDDEVTTTSTSSGRGGASRSRSTQIQRRRILDVEDLGSLPRGRCLVFASGARPVLAATVPWFNGPYKEQIEASIAKHDPNATTTVDQAAQEASTIKQEQHQLIGSGGPQ